MNQDGPLQFTWPPVIYGGAALVALLLSFLVPLPWIPRPLADFVFAMGIVVIVGGVWIILAAERAMKQAGTSILPTRRTEHLVTRGPFGFTRNPIYLGMTMLLIGVGLAMGSIWFLVSAPVAALVTGKVAIEAEEKHLEHRFGKAYRDYCRKVRRWV